MTRLALILAAVALSHAADTRLSWASDNGNGTYSNPLFYDEFSDPDMIRVGSDYYLTGTTMHAMPGLPILHSRDLVAPHPCRRHRYPHIAEIHRLRTRRFELGASLCDVHFRHNALVVPIVRDFQSLLETSNSSVKQTFLFVQTA